MKRLFHLDKVEGMMSDDPGAETTFNRIVLYKPRVTNDIQQANVILNTSLRLIHILDQHIRNERLVKPNQLSIEWDKTIDEF